MLAHHDKAHGQRRRHEQAERSPQPRPEGHGHESATRETPAAPAYRTVSSTRFVNSSSTTKRPITQSGPAQPGRAARLTRIGAPVFAGSPRRHVRGRSHPPRVDDVSRRVYRHRRVQHPQGIRLRRNLRRNRQPHQPCARSDPRLRRRSRARRDHSQRHRHAVREAGHEPVPGPDEGAAQASPQDHHHLGARAASGSSIRPVPAEGPARASSIARR